jgi:hypothetical protein
MQRDRLPYLLIPLAAFIAIVPLLINGCSCGHDFDFHILSWLEAARQFTHGNLHPHWAYTPAWNAGEPRFVFYPPLSWTIGAILGLIVPWTWTPILYTWLALTAAGLSLHYLARSFTTPTAATLAAILYTVNPYMLFTAYERTAYAELLAAAWIPLLLHAILRRQITIPRIAIPIALLWLTNAPAAVMSCYALALLTIIRLATDSSNRFVRVALNERSVTNPGAPYLDSEMWASRPSATALADARGNNAPSQTPLNLALNTAAGTALGLGLAAFYILPAAYERRYVQIAMAIVPFLRIEDNFLFHHTADVDHDQVLHTASLIATLLITITAIIVTISFARRNTTRRLKATTPGFGEDASSRPNPERAPRAEGEVERPPHFVDGSHTTSNIRPLLTSITILTTAITLLLTPLTLFIWNHAPELTFLQFPWRLLAILAAILALTIAIALTHLSLKPISVTAITLVSAAALTFPAYIVFHQTCDKEDTVQARLALFHSNQGTDPTDEYTPVTADNDSIAHTDPTYWLSLDPNAKAPTNTQPNPAPADLTVNSPAPEDLILNLRDYPAWHITLNGTPITTRIHRDDGLIALPIAAGPSTISITYAQTLDETIGDSITAFSLILLLLTLRRKSRLPSTSRVLNHP